MKSGIYVFKHRHEKKAYVGLGIDAFARSKGHFLQLAGVRKLKLKRSGKPTRSKGAMYDAVQPHTLEGAHETFTYEVVETVEPCYTLLNAAEKRWETKLLAEGYELYNTDPAGQSPLRCACCRRPNPKRKSELAVKPD